MALALSRATAAIAAAAEDDASFLLLLVLLLPEREAFVGVTETLLLSGGVALPLRRLLMRDKFAALLLLLFVPPLLETWRGVMEAALVREFDVKLADVDDDCVVLDRWCARSIVTDGVDDVVRDD